MSGSEVLTFEEHRLLFELIYNRLYVKEQEFAFELLSERLTGQKMREQPTSPRTLDEIIMRFSEWQCQDPRDEVYALLGVISQRVGNGEVSDTLPGYEADDYITGEELYAKLYNYLVPSGNGSCLGNVAPYLLGKPVGRPFKLGWASRKGSEPENQPLPPSP
jgi:hypothetical protein